jgi:hypothetical protein
MTMAKDGKKKNGVDDVPAEHQLPAAVSEQVQPSADIPVDPGASPVPAEPAPEPAHDETQPASVRPLGLPELKARVEARQANFDACKAATADAAASLLEAEHDLAVAAIAQEKVRTKKDPKGSVYIDVGGVRQRTRLNAETGKYRLDRAPIAPPVIY